MGNNNMTAVEWLIQQILLKHPLITQFLPDWSFDKSIVEQAKQIDKSQKEECWDAAHQAGRFEGKGIAEQNWQTFEQFYQETYGK